MAQFIIHVDMDAFFASVEIRDNPELRGKPLIIGALPSERGVVATCSYEARKYGVHSAMNIKEAFRRCPGGTYMHPNIGKYKAVSLQLNEIWNTYATVSQRISLDEAYLDVGEQAGDWEGARAIGHLIKQRTLEEVGLTCSVGVAYSKTAAKMASEEDKPDGYYEILTPEDFVNLIIDRDVSVLYTVGEQTAKK
ncbi:MAG: DNA polymerase IV, partial [Bacteroidales bacterium]|nr:DNA polymerase IV [Bacteroidales bacterium]